MSFDPEQLKRIALAARKKKEEPEEDLPISIEVVFTQDEVLALTNDLESSVVAWAEDGELSIDYDFNTNISPELVAAVAQSFKQRHPRLMVIEVGKHKIIVNWEGKNHV